MSGSGLPWTSGVLADGPLVGKRIYCVNRTGELVHCGNDITYEVTTLAEADRPAALTQVVGRRSGEGPIDDGRG